MLRMDQAPLQPRNVDPAWWQRRAAALCARRWGAAWEVLLLSLLALVAIGALVGMVLLLMGQLRVELSPQSAMLFFLLVTALGGALSLIARLVQVRASNERAHLEAMSEGQVQEYVYQLGFQTQNVAVMGAMTLAGETLNRGKAMRETLTNQNIEHARLDAKLASAPPANPLSPAAAALQDAVSKRSNGKSRR